MYKKSPFIYTFAIRIITSVSFLILSSFLPNTQTQTDSPQPFVSYQVNPQTSDIAFYFKGHGGKWMNKPLQTFWTLRNYLISEEQKKPVFITNAGIFKPNHEPEGLYVEDGVEVFPLNMTKKRGNFYMQPNGVFCILDTKEAIITTSDQYPALSKVRYATQSGPMLLKNGQINTLFTPHSANKHLRSGVGIMQNGDVVFVISEKPCNFYDFASIFKKQFGCDNALYLDGVISEMYASELKRYNYGNSRIKYAAMIAVSERVK